MPQVRQITGLILGPVKPIDCKIVNCCFSSQHAILSCKNIISTGGLLFQQDSTMEIQLSILIQYKTYTITTSSKSELLSLIQLKYCPLCIKHQSATQCTVFIQYYSIVLCRYILFVLQIFVLSCLFNSLSWFAPVLVFFQTFIQFYLILCLVLFKPLFYLSCLFYSCKALLINDPLLL